MWQRIKTFFKGSEVIFWARVQLLIGTIATAVTFVDPQLVAPIIDPHYLPWFLLANGVATEYLRRRRMGDQ